MLRNEKYANFQSMYTILRDVESWKDILRNSLTGNDLF